MKEKRWLFFLLPFVLLIIASGSSWAEQDSWIFQSEVAPGQSVWGTSSTGYNYSDNYEYKAGPFVAGFNWELEADPGTVFGNVQGLISAQYDKVVNGLGQQTISLSYAGQNNESQIGTNLGVKLTGNPYVGLTTPWGNLTANLNGKFVDIDVNTKKDFTTGLDTTVSDTARYNVLPFNADVLIVSGDLNVYLDNDISFTPEMISGIMKYTHFDPGIGQFDPLSEKQVAVQFQTDADLLDIPVDLDQPGLWEFSLENFSLSENTFNQKIGPGVFLAVGVPLLSFEVSTDLDFGISFGGGDFQLDFLNHGDDGDPETIDRLGRFCVYVAPVPLPGALIFFGSGLLGLIGLKRRFRV